MIRLSAVTPATRLALTAFYFTGATAADLSKRPDNWFGSDEGRKAMDCILSWQSDHGDWPKNTDTTKYALKDIGSERRNGYAWYGNWGESLATAYAKWPYR